MIGHLGPVRALAAVRGVDAPAAGVHRASTRAWPNALAAAAYDADAAGDAARRRAAARGGVGLVSGGGDGTVGLWAPDSGAPGCWGGLHSDAGSPPGGSLSESTWSCVGRARARGGVCLVEVGKSRRGVAVVTAADDARLRRGRRRRRRRWASTCAGSQSRAKSGARPGVGAGSTRGTRRIAPARGSTVARRSGRSPAPGETTAGSAARGEPAAIRRSARRRLGGRGGPMRVKIQTSRGGGARGVGARPHAPPPHARAPPRARSGPRGGEAGERVPRRKPDVRDAAGMGVDA